MSRSRHVGKIRKRLEDVKNQWIRPAKADFSDNESARLATDALLDGGPEAYWHALRQEGEVDFLSSVEAEYIQAQTKEPPSLPDPAGGAEAGSRGHDSYSLQSGTYFPVASTGSEPDLLHNWTLAEKPYLKEKSSATVYFQTDKHNNIRDLVRRCISRASQVLAILMDVFTDVEIFCDILEAANKRGVLVCVLLDQGGVKLFKEMCDKIQISDIHLKNISIRSVEGGVYCAKSGRKFAGQIQEKFIISDWRFVLSGSYSFSWLCGHVHRNILSKFTGQAVELFDEEFQHLYASSKLVMGLKSPRLVPPLQPSKGLGAPNGHLSGSSGSTSDHNHTSSNPFSSLSNGSNPLNQSLSRSSGPASPLAPIPPAVPRLQPYHSPRRVVPPQAVLVPMRPHEVAPVPYNNFMAYRPTQLQLQLQQLGLVPRVTHVWRPFLQALPHF
ncbi:FAM83A [Sigmodon hispidus]